MQKPGTVTLFSKQILSVRKKYAAFIADGVEQGQRPDLTGGGLVRSLAGQLAQEEESTDYGMASDERILGSGEFVEEILKTAELELDMRQSYRAAGFDLEQLTTLVAGLCEVDPAEVRAAGKQPVRVRARSLFCYWAVRDLGFTATALARELGVSQPAVTQAVQRGERLVAERGWKLSNLTNL